MKQSPEKVMLIWKRKILLTLLKEMNRKIFFSHHKVYFCFSSSDHRAVVLDKMHIVQCIVMPFIQTKKMQIGSPVHFGQIDVFIFFLQYSQFQQFYRGVWGGPLHLGRAKEPHIGSHISVLLVLKQVLEEVVVGLGLLEERELSGPSNHFPLACKKHTGSGPIPSILGSYRSSLAG